MARIVEGKPSPEAGSRYASFNWKTKTGLNSGLRLSLFPTTFLQKLTIQTHQNITQGGTSMRKFGILAFCIVVAVGTILAQAKKQESVKLALSGLHCDNCVEKVDKALRGVEGIKDVKVGLESAEITFASASVKTDALIKAVKDAGFQAEVGTAKSSAKAAKKEGDDCCKEDVKMKKADAGKMDDCCKAGEKKSKADAGKMDDCCKQEKKSTGTH